MRDTKESALAVHQQIWTDKKWNIEISALVLLLETQHEAVLILFLY